MTPDMKFEGLLLSPDVQVLRGMSDIMEDLSIDIDVCMHPSRAVDVLGKRDLDLLVVDWKDDSSSDVVRTVRNGACRKTTIAALVDRHIGGDLAIQAGAHAVIEKPLSGYSKYKFLTLVYSRMVAERRHSHRYAVQWLVAAKNQNDRPVALTMTDISETGIGLSSTAKVLVGDLLKLRVSLSGANQIIQFETRVVWTLPGNVAGAEFVNISVADSDVLHKWLQQQCHVENLGPRYTNLPLVHNLDPRLQG
ncbi:MAG TPA: PilZ domain-containing protein [Terriglobales bacterium]|nr:PilZ domain-containing protein [Terriglobales bacterium]